MYAGAVSLWRDAASRVNTGEATAAWCGAVMLIALLFDWYGVRVSGPLGQHGARGTTFGGHVSGWDSLHGVRAGLIAIVLVALVNVAVAARGGSQYGPVCGLLAGGAGVAAVVLCAWRLLSPPIHEVALQGSFTLRVSVEWGGFVAAAAAFGIAIAAWQGAARRLSVPHHP
jgi:hypothetical protein